MSVDISEYRDRIYSRDLGRYLKDRTGKGQLRQLVAQWLAKTSRVGQVATPNLQLYVDKYAEQVASDVMADLSKYLTAVQSRGFTTGGMTTGLPPLAILPRDVKPSNTAISAVGEALAGWYLETRKNMVPLARPIGEGPDLIFMDRRRGYYALVQVKGTQEPDLRVRLRDAALDLLDYAGKVKLMAPSMAYSSYIIGIVIKTASDYELVSLQIDLM